VNPRAVIAEDESLLREQLRDLLAAAWPELESSRSRRTARKPFAPWTSTSPMSSSSTSNARGFGLEVARLASGRCHVVFVTAYDQYAVAASRRAPSTT
jgi:DNA-binding LytR/AlgR family response regulator